MKKKGFTLIELLVVIAIIGLLAVLALAALGSARTKAANTKKNGEITQYAKVMEMAYDKNGEYPDTGVASTWYCLGKYSGDTCWLTSSPFSKNDALNAATSPFIPSLPGSGPIVCDRMGYIYQCATIVGGRCTSLIMQWILQGTNQSCGGGHIEDGNFSGGCTLCNWSIPQ